MLVLEGHGGEQSSTLLRAIRASRMSGLSFCVQDELCRSQNSHQTQKIKVLRVCVLAPGAGVIGILICWSWVAVLCGDMDELGLGWGRALRQCKCGNIGGGVVHTSSDGCRMSKVCILLARWPCSGGGSATADIRARMGCQWCSSRCSGWAVSGRGACGGSRFSDLACLGLERCRMMKPAESRQTPRRIGQRVLGERKAPQLVRCWCSCR